MWCAILDNRQIQLRDLHSVKDLSTNLKKKKKIPKPAMEQSRWLPVVTLSHTTVGEYYFLPSIMVRSAGFGSQTDLSSNHSSATYYLLTGMTFANDLLLASIS